MKTRAGRVRACRPFMNQTHSDLGSITVLIRTRRANPRARCSPAGPIWAPARLRSGWRCCAPATIICAEPFCASRAAPTSWWAHGFLPPDEPQCAAAVIFFNNAGYLGMCGHGTIGVAVTLAHLGRIAPGRHRLQTPVGTVKVDLHSAHTATIENVPAYRYAAGVRVKAPGYGEFRGDVAWGGNWFFLIKEHPFELRLKNVDELTEFTWAVRRALNCSRHYGRGRRGDRPHRVVWRCARRGQSQPQLCALSRQSL